MAKEPTIIKEFPGQAVEQFRQEHGGALPAEVKCCYCGGSEGEIDKRGKEIELRPYGPNSAWLCYGCMKETPEREAEADRQIGAAFEAAERTSRVVLIGENTGPRPLGGRKG